MFKFTKFNTKQFCSVKKKQFPCLMLTRDGPGFVKKFLSFVGGGGAFCSKTMVRKVWE